MEPLLYAADTVYTLVFAAAAVLAALQSQRDLSLARRLVIFGAIIVTVRWGVWAITTDTNWPVRAVVGALIGATLFALVPGAIHWLSDRIKPSASKSESLLPGRPLLRLGYAAHDLNIRWPQSSISTETDDHKSPWAFLLKNIGGQKAINVELSFSTPIDLDSFPAELKSFAAFPNVEERDKGNYYVQLEWVLGKPTKTTVMGFKAENIRRIVTLSSDSSDILVFYPPVIQSILNLVVLNKAFVVGAKVDAERSAKMSAFSTEPTDKALELMSEYSRQIDHQMTIAVPDVDVSINTNSQ